MPRVVCEAKDCEFNVDGECSADDIEMVIDERNGMPFCEDHHEEG